MIVRKCSNLHSHCEVQGEWGQHCLSNLPRLVNRQVSETLISPDQAACCRCLIGLRTPAAICQLLQSRTMFCHRCREIRHPDQAASGSSNVDFEWGVVDLLSQSFLNLFAIKEHRWQKCVDADHWETFSWGGVFISRQLRFSVPLCAHVFVVIAGNEGWLTPKSSLSFLCHI